MDNLKRSRIKPQKPRPIARKRHNYIYLLMAILFGASTAYIFLNFPPSHKFDLSGIGIPTIPVFFASLVGFIFCTLTFIFVQKTQGIIVSFFTILYLVLRMVGLTHWLFTVLVIGLFVAVELFISKQK